MASNYGCGAETTCMDCYPVIYRCWHGVDYPEPLPNTEANRVASDECLDPEHEDEAWIVEVM
jgi:hypothetical protein